MSLEALASTLKKQGIGCSIVLAATGAASAFADLDNKKFALVAASIIGFQKVIDELVSFGNSVADLPDKQRARELTKFLDALQAFESVFNELEHYELFSGAQAKYTSRIGRVRSAITKIGGTNKWGTYICSADEWATAIEPLLTARTRFLDKEFKSVLAEVSKRGGLFPTSVRKLVDGGPATIYKAIYKYTRVK